MTRKPTTKSPEERRLRKHIRELLQVYAADLSRHNTDATVRMFLDLIDDEVRRTRMSIAPIVDMSTMPVMNPRDDVAGAVLKSIFPTPKAWKEWADKVTSGGK